jgi:phage tail-like protein
MAVQRDTPYGSFNFLVDFATGDVNSVRAGFQEVSGMNIEVTSADYRNGNSKDNHPTKVDGLYKVDNVTFRRGYIGATDLYEWIDAIRTGTRRVIPTVTVTLLDEAHEGPVSQFVLLNARAIKWTAPSLNAKTGTDVAIEELVLSIEDLIVQ